MRIKVLCRISRGLVSDSSCWLWRTIVVLLIDAFSEVNLLTGYYFDCWMLYASEFLLGIITQQFQIRSLIDDHHLKNFLVFYCPIHFVYLLRWSQFIQCSSRGRHPPIFSICAFSCQIRMWSSLHNGYFNKHNTCSMTCFNHEFNNSVTTFNNNRFTSVSLISAMSY